VVPGTRLRKESASVGKQRWEDYRAGFSFKET
jgi:hypothetical protein